ncbi:Phosphoserine phosphatase [hydrothermal vent metagenome]|uniref:Phosphoserine phosphatase n=1 Tax=hydrothermal vent metagenome TaxID=652676 RepID=A0A3B1B540_9ZZZZ
MALAIFDLDNTLICDDSDHLWGDFLADQGIVDADLYKRENDRFFREYQEGKLDIFEFLQFSLKPLSQHEPEALYAWREQFVAEKIVPVILPAGQKLIQKHQDAGDTLMIITATNAFVTSPIAELLGVENLIATEPEMIDGRYTGQVAGTPSYQKGKVERLNQWLAEHGANLDGSCFYSDSHNDIPLLKVVEQPVAVDPDEALAEYAREQRWPVISLRE